jgi:hypothetical protein
MRDDFVLILEFDSESGVRKQFRDDPGKLQQFFLRHSLSGFFAAVVLHSTITSEMGAGK